MAKSIKYKKPDTYHDAGNVYDNTQQKTQEEINASMTPTDEVSFTENDYTVYYCKSGNIATVIASNVKYQAPSADVNFVCTHKLPFAPWINTSLAVSNYSPGGSSMAINPNGTIQIIHRKASDWYRCTATFIAKDI